MTKPKSGGVVYEVQSNLSAGDGPEFHAPGTLLDHEQLAAYVSEESVAVLIEHGIIKEVHENGN